jgi:hypothetical protein
MTIPGSPKRVPATRRIERAEEPAGPFEPRLSAHESEYILLISIFENFDKYFRNVPIFVHF